jgi:transaldolase/glucose-6-phosphate isomerase
MEKKVESMTKLHELAEQGQAIWFDFIRRSFIDTGELQELVDKGVRGVTSNPTIFEKAIAGSTDYDWVMGNLVAEGKSVDEIYEALAFDDIGKAAQLLRPLYDESDGADGYVSMEVSPTLAHDTAGTIADAQRIFATLQQPNVMIKIPATSAGIPAIEATIAAGINVNVTLIFSLEQYRAVAEAYLSGLEKLAAAGGDLRKVASVASFFVSRVDAMVDAALTKLGNQALQGKIAIDNAKVAYAEFQQFFSGPRWQRLADRGARVQRPLWASTGVKNPHYPDTLYVDNLVGPNTVNTLPPATLNAVLDHGQTAATITQDVAHARARLSQLAALGIDLGAITQKLQDEGVAAFVKSFETLMASINEKRERLRQEWRPMQASLDYELALLTSGVLEELKRQRILTRIWAHDHTVWKAEPSEISNRLGWLHIAEIMQDSLPIIDKLVAEVRQAGYTHALLLGMGGSSLAPELFRKTFGVKAGYLDLVVLDSTDPGAVAAQAERLDPAKTLYIVSTKSGGTVETFSFFKYFYNRTVEAVGRDEAGAHFVAITDPGSGLAAAAEEYHFRTTFLNDPTIGGRYSALSYFGLAPAALLGVDLPLLLDRAINAMYNGQECNCLIEGDNNSARLGVIMGELAKLGRDKVTMITSPAIASFGDWVEQLIAESTGKEGKGILPVVGEPLGAPNVYGPDRLFVYLRLDGDETHDAAVNALAEAGHPTVVLALKDLYDVGDQFFTWEMATAVAGQRLGINPFDQPNVEAAKVLARQMVAAYQQTGRLPESLPLLRSNGVTVYGNVMGATAKDALAAFLMDAPEGGYIALQAYVEPTPATDAALLALRTHLRNQTRLATTAGYGPRFLHSTGQLHKGDAGKGLFIQFTSETSHDLAIPDQAGEAASSIRFGVLKLAQALGDGEALRSAGRRLLCFHFTGDVIKGLTDLMAEM